MIAVLLAAATKEPGNVRWKFGGAIVLRFSGKGLDARDLFEEAAKAEPERSEYQYWYGASVFETIDEVGMLGKMSAASKGKAALEKAIALDPSNVRARQALFQFYLQAPGIAGGSIDKAREQARAVIATPGGVGAFRGQMMLAQLAVKEEDWAAMSKAEAATHYDEFAKRFPKDDRAGKAKDQAAKLRKG